MVNNKCYYFAGVINNETCDKIIQLGLSQYEKEGHSATTAGDASKHNKPDAIPQNSKTVKDLTSEGVDFKKTYIRDSKVSWLDEKWIYDMIEHWVDKANNEAGWKFDYDFMESTQFTQYENSGFYGWHNDGNGDYSMVYKPYIHGVTNEPQRENGGLPHGYVTNKTNMIGKVRKLSFILNLTDGNEYEGGDILFDLGNHNTEGQIYKNEIMRKRGTVIVFPSFVYHCVTPVTKGKRMSLVNWCLGRPFK